jgi:ketosteroid isomerase-like protein
MKLRCSCLLPILFLTIATLAQEPVQPKLTPRITTATRQVSLFSGVEKQMLQAVQKKDKATLEAMLADDCQITFPKSDTLDCGDWMDSVLAPDFTLKSFSVRNMSVTDLGDSALVNFDRVQQATHGAKDLSGEFFVLDLWKKSGNSWKLVNRYVSRSVNAASNPATSPTPTGKQ